MANRQLTDDERKRIFEPLVYEVRKKLVFFSKGDEGLLWALCRKLTKELGYDERGKPLHRKILKLKKMPEQKGTYAVCGNDLPKKIRYLFASKQRVDIQRKTHG